MGRQLKLWIKGIRVIRDCETPEQLQVAKAYIDLAIKKLKDSDDHVFIKASWALYYMERQVILEG